MSCETIYMALIDEGIDVWRPVQAERLIDDRYRVHGPMPETEHWKFPPGSIVVAQEMLLSGEKVLVAA